MEILKSKRETEKAERDLAISTMYTSLLREYPDAKPWRIVRTIGEKYDLSPEWVRTILIEQGAYINNKKFQS